MTYRHDNNLTNTLSNDEVFYRLPQIIGDKRHGIEPRIPVSRSTWWDWVKEGKAPRSIKLSERVTVWRKSDIDALIDRLGAE